MRTKSLIAPVLLALSFTQTDSARPRVIVQPSDLVAPFITNGPNVRTRLTFVNLDAANSSLEVIFNDINGAPMSLPFVDQGTVSSYTDTIPPNGTLEMVTDGVSAPQGGWALYIPANKADIALQVGVETQLSGVWLASTYNAGNRYRQTSTVRFDNRDGYDTSIIVLSTNSQGPEAIVLSIADSQGNPIAAAPPLTLSSLHESLLDLAAAVPATAGMAGTVTITGGNSAVPALGIRLHTAAGVYEFFDSLSSLASGQSQ